MTDRTWLNRARGVCLAGLFGLAVPTSAFAAEPPRPGAPSAEPPEELPKNRYFLQIGLRPKALSFAGLLQLGLLEDHAQAFHGLAQVAGWEAGADRFAGVAQFGLAGATSEKEIYAAAQVSLGTSRARGIYAVAQASLYRNIASEAFVGGVQWSLLRNDVDSFAGVLQASLRNRARRVITLAQVGVHNKIDRELDEDVKARPSSEKTYFIGALQLGVYNKMKNGRFVALAQVGGGNVIDGDFFAGGVQLGLVNFVNDNFYGLAQVGAASFTNEGFYGLAQVGVIAAGREFNGLAQAGVVNITKKDWSGLVQVGAMNAVGKEFRGVAQIGVLNADSEEVDDSIFKKGGRFTNGRFSGLLQVGVANMPAREFRGLLQLGVLVTGADRVYALAQASALIAIAGDEFKGLFQVGTMTYAGKDFRGLSQVGLVNFVKGELFGAQIGALGNYVRGEGGHGLQVGSVNATRRGMEGMQIGLVNVGSIDGAQVGVYNSGDAVTGAQVGGFNKARKVTGVQVGVVNYTSSLEGVQLGGINLSRKGGLPVSALVNVGF